MSLINRMLQDLEQRSASDPFGSGMQQQVRAAPERSSMHLAWWLVLLLSIVLVVVCVWLWLRPPAELPRPLASKMTSNLAVLPVASPPVVVVPAPLPVAPTPVPPTISATDANNVPSAPDARHDDAVPLKPKKTTSLSPQHTKPARVAVIRQTATDASAPADALAGSSGSSDDAVKASKLTKQVQELTPGQQAENDYRSAVSALQQGRQADAIANLEQALQLDLHHAAARQMLVGVLLQAKRTDDAVHRAQDGLVLDPAQTGLAMILARIQVDHGDVKSALTTLENSLPYALERADYQAFLAALLQRDKRHKEAVEHYIAALTKEPQNGVWWMGLGISLQAESHLPEAKEAFKRAKTTNTLSPALQAFVDQKLAQLR